MYTSRHKGFTLAEVLITLGIIGVVAAMTMPALIQKNNNRVVETRLAKFYSNINQAIKLAEVDYGDKKYWYLGTNSIVTDQDGNPVNGSSEAEKWWNKYMAPYIKTIDTKYDDQGLPIFYFTDGSALKPRHTTELKDWIYFVTEPNKCIKKYNNIDNTIGKCAFFFLYDPTPKQGNAGNYKFHTDKGFEPYKYKWDGTLEGLYNGSYSGCNNTHKGYCTALIQYNGWKIPDDYPFKVSY